ncbi:hypothetical protein [Scytonema sp. PCC 10023]|uniref:hypothetical protein n=1 Tax=Scytonema sp. PCC 10023 TaxID=1680591 RepID=UPI0039C6D386
MSRAKAAKKQKLAKRIISWLTYDTIFALLPLGISIPLTTLAGKLSIEAFTKSPEILFFSLMISANSMRDINEISAPIGRDLTFTIFSLNFPPIKKS